MNKLNPNSQGFKLSPGPMANSVLSVLGAGTAYQLTATPALINLGTTPPTLTITEPGTYLILARVQANYNLATFAAVRTATFKLRRTNNTAADLAGGSTSYLTDVVTTKTLSLVDDELPHVIYTTANNNDIIQIFGSLDVVPSAGSLDVTEAQIIAIKLS